MPKITGEPVIKRSFYKKEKKKERPAIKISRALSITLFLVFMALVLGGLAVFWVVKDELNQNFLSDLGSQISWQLRKRAQTSPDKIVFDGKLDNAYAPFQDGLAVLTTNRLVCYDATGKEFISAERVFKNPCLQTSYGTLMAYDRGGNTFVLTNSNAIIVDIKTERPIITGKMNRRGYTALVTQGEGYKSVVWVYNSKGKLVYKYSSPEYYIIDASISPDSSLIALSCAGYDQSWINGQIKVFSLRSEEPVTVIDLAGSPPFELFMPDSDKISGVFENSISFWHTNGVLLNQTFISGRILLDYSFIDSGVAVRTARDESGTDILLQLYDFNGGLIETTAVSDEVICQSGGGSYVTLVTSAGILVYDNRLHLKSQEPNTTHARQILQRDNGTMFLIFSDYAQLYSP